MTTFITGGQSFEDIAFEYTLSPAYGIAIANYNNMPGESITGKKFYITVPDAWVKSDYSGKYVTLPNVISDTVKSKTPLFIIAALGILAIAFNR